MLSKIAHMHHEEPGPGMTGHDPVSRFEQRGISGKVTTVERPVRMIVQLLVTLVEPIGGSEEGNRVGDVNRDGHVQLPARIPHWIEPSIVDLHQLSLGDAIPQVKAERLEDLEPSGS